MDQTRTCRVCLQVKNLLSDFKAEKRRTGAEYRGFECKACESTRKKVWHDQHRERVLANMAEYRKTRKDRPALWSEEKRAKRTAYMQEFRAKVKDDCYKAYGGYRCACCGETEPLFLSLDHIENDGYERRKFGKEPAGAAIYSYLKTRGYPPGFQVLCMNCNHGKSRNGGVCPHHEGSTTSSSERRPKRVEMPNP